MPKGKKGQIKLPTEKPIEIGTVKKAKAATDTETETQDDFSDVNETLVS